MAREQSCKREKAKSEKFRKTERALRESEEIYRLLVEQAGDPIVILQEGCTIYRNPAWERLLGYTVEETAQTSFLDLVVNEDRERIWSYYQNRLKGLPAPEQYECRLRTRQGNIVCMEVRPRVVHIHQRPATMVIMRDLTERRMTEYALRKSEARFRSIFQSAKDCIFIKDCDLKYVMINPCMETHFDIRAADVIGCTDQALFTEEVVAHNREVDQRVLAGESIEEEHTKQINGVEETFHVIKVPIRDVNNQISGLCGIARNITKRKEAEKVLASYHKKLRSLASQLSLAEEKERRRISNHVHDHIGQNMAFAKLKVTELKKLVREPETMEIVLEIYNLVDRAIRDTRHLVSELGSPVLYELGFVSAVKALVSEIKNRHHLALVFEDDGQQKPLSEDIQVLLYRAIRELLANMVKHAGARSGVVSLRSNGMQIVVTVKDDGTGFDWAGLGELTDFSKGYGLFSIRERLGPLGGKVEVLSGRGQGTSVVLTVPLLKS